MNNFLLSFNSGACLLLGFLLFFHPRKANVQANRWLGVFVILMGLTFAASYLVIGERTDPGNWMLKLLNGAQFLLAPSLYLSVLHFIRSNRVFVLKDVVHLLPFTIYLLLDMVWLCDEPTLATRVLFPVSRDISFLVRDLLPFLTLCYLIRSSGILRRHRSRMRQIASQIDHIDLRWLSRVLLILLLAVIIWINDALVELPVLAEATSALYTGCIFFLAYFGVRQEAIFAFSAKDLPEIARLLKNDVSPMTAQPAPAPVSGKQILQAEETLPLGQEPLPADQPLSPEPASSRRLTTEQVARWHPLLLSLMEKDRLFLENDLDLPTVAAKLGLGIHDTSYLINQTSQTNFYQFINGYRVREAKALLASSRSGEWNMLGIAFASGFNSKTTFNTTFRKMVGMSPSDYVKSLRK